MLGQGLEKRKIADFIQNLHATQNLHDVIYNAVSEFAEDLLIGKIETTLFTPYGDEFSTISYQNNTEGFDETDFIEHNFITGENGHVNIKIYKINDSKYKWNKSLNEDVQMIAQIMFMLYAKDRLTDIARKATHLDNMTGISNINGFLVYAQKLINNHVLSDYSSFFINIKNFKIVNKYIGYNLGNKVLIEFSRKLAKTIEPYGIFARLGGDNFISIIKNEKVDFLIKLLSEIPVEINNGKKNPPIVLAARMGICPLNDNIKNSTTVIDNAFNAFNITRMNSKKDVVFYDETVNQLILREKEFSALFNSALNCSEFVVYYQPKVDLHTFQLIGAEALVRWNKTDEFLNPMDFIYVFERNGSICKLDFYVLELTCLNIKKWIDAGINPVKISVNFSKLHLYNSNFVSNILDILKKYSVSPEFIEIELTETTDFEDFKKLFETVSELKLLGFSTSIDDFGTGYSSLNLIKNLPVDVLKLDKSFLENNNITNRDKIVIENIINMARELNMDVISEGVETLNQAEFLKKMNCVMAQGFLFDKPLPEDEFKKRLINNKYEIS